MYYFVLFILAFMASLSIIFKVMDKVCDTDKIFSSKRKIKKLYKICIAGALVLATMYCFVVYSI